MHRVDAYWLRVLFSSINLGGLQVSKTEIIHNIDYGQIDSLQSPNVELTQYDKSFKLLSFPGNFT